VANPLTSARGPTTSLRSSRADCLRQHREEDLDPVIAAAALAFGFVYIHPFEDGNGRIHRYLMRMSLRAAGSIRLAFIFRYRRQFSTRSTSIAKCWKATPAGFCLSSNEPAESGNVNVLNDTGDFIGSSTQRRTQNSSMPACARQSTRSERNAFSEKFDKFRVGINMIDMPERTLQPVRPFASEWRAALKRARE
jgi:hypothetical protein